jgi:hypothetical protein
MFHARGPLLNLGPLAYEGERVWKSFLISVFSNSWQLLG